MSSRLLPVVVVALALGVFAACNRSPEPASSACRTNADCATLDPAAPFCVDGACAECVADQQCPVGMQCAELACVAIPGWCDSDDACDGAFVCRDNRCGPECVAHTDCGTGEACDAGTCVQADCIADADCGANGRCVDFACVDAVACSITDLDPVYFDFDQATLSRDAVATIDGQWSCLAEPEHELVLSGHADERGTQEYNLALGERRARMVKRYLTDRGVEPSMLSIVSYGELRPADRGTTERAHALNRRVEFEPTTRAASR